MEINKPILIVVVFVINLVAIFLFVIPKYEDSSHLDRVLAARQSEYENQSQYRLKLSSALRDLQVREDIVQKVDEALPSNPSLAEIIHFLNKKATENSLSVINITLSHRAAATELGTSASIKDISFMVNLTGSYLDLKRFLSSLEKSTRLLQVQTISLVPTSRTQVVGQQVLKNYNFSLEIKTYSY